MNGYTCGKWSKMYVNNVLHYTSFQIKCSKNTARKKKLIVKNNNRKTTNTKQTTLVTTFLKVEQGNLIFFTGKSINMWTVGKHKFTITNCTEDVVAASLHQQSLTRNKPQQHKAKLVSIWSYCIKSHMHHLFLLHNIYLTWFHIMS